MRRKSAHARQSEPPTDEEVKQAMEILRRFEEHAQSKHAQELLVRTDESVSEEAPESVSERRRPNRPNPEALAALYERMNWFFATCKQNEFERSKCR
jgi:hypothetical protein